MALALSGGSAYDDGPAFRLTKPAQWVSGEMKITDPKPTRAIEFCRGASKDGWFQDRGIGRLLR